MFKPSVMLLALSISSPIYAADGSPGSSDKNFATPNSLALFKSIATVDAEPTPNNDAAKGAVGIEAGSAVDGNGSNGSVYWFVQKENVYDLSLSFNLGSTASIDADLSNIGDVVRNTDEFGQFSFSGKRIFWLLGISVPVVAGASYTEFSFDNSEDVNIDNGGVLATKFGFVMATRNFQLTSELEGAVGLTVAYERRDIVGDLANNKDQLDQVFQSNGDSYDGYSATLDIAVENSQRYFVKLTHFDDADGLKGLDGNQITVGVKINGKLINYGD